MAVIAVCSVEYQHAPAVAVRPEAPVGGHKLEGHPKLSTSLGIPHVTTMLGQYDIRKHRDQELEYWSIQFGVSERLGQAVGRLQGFLALLAFGTMSSVQVGSALNQHQARVPGRRMVKAAL